MNEMLLDSLSEQRRHVLGILDGLDDAALRRPLLPTGWSCLGMVAHLAYDVERFWFRRVVAGEEVELPDNPWDVGPDVSAQSVLAAYRAEIDRANEVIADTAWDAPPAWWPEEWGHWRLDDLRGIVLHVIVETACHAGHLDAVRELIDGRTWLVLT